MIKHLFYFLLIVFIASCGKGDRDEDQSVTETTDNSLAEFAFNDVFAVTSEAALVTQGIRATSQTLACATISADTTVNPMILLVDFGTVNCTGADGRNRRGKIFATFTGKYRDSLTVITITPQDYYLNDYKVEGTKTVTNKGHNSSGNLWYTVVVQNAKITEPGGTWNVTWNSSRVREWIAGESTVTDFTDDVYLITGSANGVNRRGNSFTADITTALRVELSCNWIVSGTMTITPDNLNPRYVDFGSGSCDNDATVTVNGNVYDIEMN